VPQNLYLHKFLLKVCVFCYEVVQHGVSTQLILKSAIGQGKVPLSFIITTYLCKIHPNLFSHLLLSLLSRCFGRDLCLHILCAYIISLVLAAYPIRRCLMQLTIQTLLGNSIPRLKAQLRALT
jgi:hypothetical protein